MIQKPKGTLDILPEETVLWHFAENIMREKARLFGFEEIRFPTFELSSLFKRGVGGTTDIVQKEMFTLSDRDDTEYCLRPEGTACVARSVIENGLFNEPMPLKLYYIANFFRYEKPQAGRSREFYQFGVEMFGSEGGIADANIIALADSVIKETGVNASLNINSIGCPDCRPKHRAALVEYFTSKKEELCPTCRERLGTNPLRILDCKSPIDQELVKDAPMMLDYLCDECREAFEDLKKNLEAFGIEFTVNPRIVRGLDYYTKTAFEFITTKIGAQGTVCGGGRYDGLIEEVGGPSTPGVGWGMGKERMLMTMEACGAEIPEERGTEVFIATMGEEGRKAGIRLMSQLRREGICVQMDVMGRNLKNQFKHANRIKAKKTIVIGDNELATGRLTIKDMATGDQTEATMDSIADALK